MKRAFLFSVIFVLLFTILLLLSVFYIRMLQMSEINLAQTRNISRMAYTIDDIESDIMDYLQLSLSVESNSTQTILNISDVLVSPYGDPSGVLNSYKSFINGTYSNQTSLLDASTNVSVIYINTTTFESSPRIYFLNSNSSLNLLYSYNNLSKNELIVNGSTLLTNYSVALKLNRTCLNSNCANATWAGGPPNNDTSTVGLWHFDEGSGNYTYDSSGNGNTGVFYAGTAYFPYWTGGRFSYGVTLVYPYTESVYINDSNSLDISGPFTLEVWYKGGAQALGGWLLNKGSSGSFLDNYELYLSSSPYLNCKFSNGSTVITVTSTNTMQPSTWYHIACTADGSTLALYINGVLNNTASYSITPLPNDQPLFIGNRNSIYMYCFNGTIDEVAIYNRSKSADEIAADASLFHWDWGPIAINNNLSAAWHLDEVNGTAALDASGNGNIATFNGSTLVTIYSSSTNKAYYISNTSSTLPDSATTEFTSSNYTNIGAFDNVYVTSTARRLLSAPCSGVGSCSCEVDPETYRCLGIAEGDNCHDYSDPGLPNATSYTNDCSDSVATGCGVRTCTCHCYAPGYYYYVCNSNPTQYYSCTTSGCESASPCYLYAFQRYTYNFSSYYWSNVTSLQFCWQGFNSSNGGIYSGKLMWYNVSSATWVNSYSTSGTESTQCITFSGANLTDVYNSTGTWVQFAVKGNQSNTGHQLNLYADFVYAQFNFAIPIAPWTTGKFNNGILLNGTTFGEANDSTSLGITGQLTLEGWVKPTSVTPAYQAIFYKGNSTTENYGLYLKGSDLYFEWVNFGTRSLATTSANLQPNTWYHVAAVFNSSGNVTLYVNGTQLASLAQATDLLTNIGTLRIGENTSTGNYFNGTLDELAIYSRVKSAGEIYADANPIYVSTSITDALNNPVSIRGASNGYVNPSANNTMYLRTDSGGLNMTVGAYSGFYSLRIYANNTQANLLLKTIQNGASDLQAVLPIQLWLYNQSFSSITISAN